MEANLIIKDTEQNGIISQKEYLKGIMRKKMIRGVVDGVVTALIIFACTLMTVVVSFLTYDIYQAMQ